VNRLLPPIARPKNKLEVPGSAAVMRVWSWP
jgi:hypothetical protein